MKAQKNRRTHEILRLLPYGLYVVGVRGKQDGDMNALVVNWLTQCSFDPPLIMVAFRQGTRSCELLKEGKVFSVNLIDKKDRRLMQTLVKPSDRIGDKLGKIGHVEEDTGAPILRKAFAYIECKVRKLIEPGDHALAIGEVVNAAWHGQGEPLTCADLRWHYAG